MSYTTREVERLLGLRPAQVRAFVRDGFLAPGRGRRGELRFTFQDLVLLRTARGLLEAEVPPVRVRQALRRLQARLPQGTKLAGMHLHADGRRIVVREGGALWQPESGQVLFDFDVGQLAREVASLDQLRAAEGAEGGPAGADQALPSVSEPADAEGLYQLGCRVEEEDPAQAVRCYQRALELDPAHLEARVNLGRLLHDRGEPHEAERHYRVVLAEHPDDLTATFNLAVALEDLGRSDEAVAGYQKALALDPGCADAHFNLSRLFEQQGQRMAALRHLQAYRRLTRA